MSYQDIESGVNQFLPNTAVYDEQQTVSQRNSRYSFSEMPPSTTSSFNNSQTSHISNLPVEPKESQDLKMTTGKMIYLFLTDPNFNIYSKMFYYFDLLTVLFAILVFLLESEYHYDSGDGYTLWFIIESCITAYFTIELMIRFLTYPKKKMFLNQSQNVIDLLSILPYFLILITLTILHSDNIAEGMVGIDSSSGAIPVLRIFRLLRILRLFRLGRHNANTKMMLQAVKVSMDGIFMMIMLYIISLIFFSSLVYYAETTSCSLGNYSAWDNYEKKFINSTILIYTSAPNPIYNGLPCAFQSIPEAFWFTMVTLGTVGYGDIVVRSVMGKISACFMMVTGVLLLGFPVSIFSANFSEIYRIHHERQEREKKELRRNKEAARIAGINKKKERRKSNRVDIEAVQTEIEIKKERERRPSEKSAPLQQPFSAPMIRKTSLVTTVPIQPPLSKNTSIQAMVPKSVPVIQVIQHSHDLLPNVKKDLKETGEFFKVKKESILQLQQLLSNYGTEVMEMKEKLNGLQEKQRVIDLLLNELMNK